ncbi:MAG TPA: hypothetical protein VFV33_16095, partial [Gemmatimonadaceae bacterium]|nr:hypothetical protein [Gemmatimonadaceae bacterium]
QMTGGPSGPMSTTGYFPLVDGARYEYVFLSGPHAAASAVMHGGQTWAGMGNLTGVHMRLTCRDVMPCVTDADDFYAMTPDGVRWYGGITSTPGGPHSMMTLTNPEWPIKNPVMPGTMMAGGMGSQNAEQWQGAVAGMSTMMGAVAYSSMYQAMGLETVTTPAGTFANCLRIHEKRGSGDERDVWYAPDLGIVRWTYGVEEAVLAKVTMPTAPVVQVAYAVEYHHAALDHYFVTASPAEIGGMDRGDQPGWQRTGLGFFVVDAGDTSATTSFPVCRFYGRPEYGLNTHFYSGSADECAAVPQKWPMQWLEESGNVFRTFMPDVDGTCPADTLPVYRSWNGRSDSNHRFTMDASVHRSMMARGSMAEGVGSPAVAMCSPL